jgi:hypothetical protein
MSTMSGLGYRGLFGACRRRPNPNRFNLRVFAAKEWLSGLPSAS